MAWRLAVALLALLAGAALPAITIAAPRVPTDGQEVVEQLPALGTWAREERRLRREIAARPRDEALALRTAQALLDAAREQGDARYAGQALGVLRPWEPHSAATPVAVLVMHATLAQYLHDFDAAEATLKKALTQDRNHAQAWIDLATILRVRGRYAESDAACEGVARAGQNLYAIACLAENAGLRGDHAGARKSLEGLLASPAVQGAARAGTRQWLLTTMAAIEEQAGRPAAAEQAYRKALDTERTHYTLLAYADFLLAQRRPGEVEPLLRREPRSDAVLLRLAMAARHAAGAPSRDADELQARFEASALRPGSTAVHAREQSMFALDVRQDARRALELARLNVALQREPIDLLIYARAAAAANDDGARRALAAMVQGMGLRDARIDALLL